MNRGGKKEREKFIRMEENMMTMIYYNENHMKTTQLWNPSVNFWLRHNYTNICNIMSVILLDRRIYRFSFEQTYKKKQMCRG